jgi:AcrR family transcriptional regulator
MESTKDRIVIASAELFRRQGYNGTGLKQIVAEAQAPFGSIYHHFPGGKDELAEEVIRRSGAFYLLLFEVIMDPAPDVVTGVRDFFAGAAETLRSTDYADACPIAVVALEVASTNDPLRQATADVFDSWLVELQGRFAAAGVPADEVRPLAITVIAGLEGAFLFSRAMRTTEAMDAAGAYAAAAVQAALPVAA